MSWGPRRRRLLQRLALRAALAGGGLAITATLTLALQVRRIEVIGVQRFAAADVEHVLRAALGSPTLTARPDELRAAVRAIPWVAEASVRVSLDGVVTCTLSERHPVALAVDGERRELVDREGRLLGPAAPGEQPTTLEGFGPYPGERARLLAALPEIERQWGRRLLYARRIAPHDVALEFASTTCTVLADPGRTDGVATARRVLAAWMTAGRPAPARLDARLVGRVAVTPARPTAETEDERS